MLHDRRRDHQAAKPPAERALFNRPREERPLTEKQQRVLQYIAETIELLNEPPSLLTLSRRFNVAKETIHAILKALRAKGFIEMDGAATRTIKLTGKSA